MAKKQNDNYIPLQGQMNFFEYCSDTPKSILNDFKRVNDKIIKEHNKINSRHITERFKGMCDFCVYNNNKNTLRSDCLWKIENKCTKGEMWKPHAFIIKGLCASCEYGNCFAYTQDKDKIMYDENTYCTYGSSHRHSMYPEYVRQPELNKWHENHEYDTCDSYREKKHVLTSKIIYKGDVRTNEAFYHDTKRKTAN